MKYYRIGEFARMCGISVELLKYYDRKGLLRPAFRDESGIRYYADFQFVHLAEYYQLNQLGISLQNAKSLRESGSLADCLSQLTLAQTKIEHEIQEKQEILRHLSDLREMLDKIQQKNCWSVEWWEGGFFLNKDQAARSEQKMARSLFDVWQRVLLDSGNGSMPEQTENLRSWGTILPLSTQETDIPMEPVPSGSCFVYYHSIPADYVSMNETAHLSNQVWNFEEPLMILAEHGLKPRGDLYQRRLCVTHEAGGDKVQVLTRIPLQNGRTDRHALSGRRCQPGDSGIKARS